MTKGVNDPASCEGVAGGGLGLINSVYDSSTEESSDETDTIGEVPVAVHTSNLNCLMDVDEAKTISEEEVKILADFGTAHLGVPTNFRDITVLGEEIKEEGRNNNTTDFTQDNYDVQITKVLSGSDSFEGPSYNEARISKVKGEQEDDSGTSDSEPDSDLSDDDTIDSDVKKGRPQSGKKKQEPRCGDLSFGDLPLIEDLHISVPREKCKLIGKIKSVVDPLVIVESVPNTPVLNLDSVLFLDEGDRALGHIFDVIGQVKDPLYCVRFNSKEHIEKNGVHPGMDVYCAPETDYTSYVFLAQLRQMKGTDASWKDDFELPPEEQEFSDDEQERVAKNGGRKKKQKQRVATAQDALATEYTNKNSFTAHNNGSRGFKRHQYQGNNQHQPRYNQGNYPPHQSQSSPYVPQFVAGFAPRPPPPPFPPQQFHGTYNIRPQQSYGMHFNGNKFPQWRNAQFPPGGGFNHNRPPPMNGVRPPPWQMNSNQTHAMWRNHEPQQNYWQNSPTNFPRQFDSNHTPTKFSESLQTEPSPPGV